MPADPEWHTKALHVLEEFVEDVEAANGEGEIEKDWPDLFLTFKKACHLLGEEEDD
jgi:hypothetical protein|tara:strand:- start:1066 stop:1233 length:168 start_codon:yes stop_codon:yes gene_type:complete